MEATENKYTPGEWIRDFFKNKWYFVAGGIAVIVIIYLIYRFKK